MGESSRSGSSKSGLKTKLKVKTKSSTNSLHDLEDQFILRLPELYAAKFAGEGKSDSLKDKFKIDLAADGRHATVKYANATLSGRVLDLPSIIESWKTLDKKSFWKTADISQMLWCREAGDSNESSSEEDEIKSSDPFKKQQLQAKKFLCPHGITPPLKNVRKKRFRKTAKKKYIEAPEIEKEVKRLLRADISAVDVTFEVLQDEDKQEDARSITSDLDIGNSMVASPSHFNEESMQSPASYLENEEEVSAILPDISSSDEDVDIHDLHDYHNDSKVSNDSMSDMPMTGSSQVSDEAVRRVAELQLELLEIQAKRAEQESRVKNSSNPFLKQRFQATLDNLMQRENLINDEMKDLQHH